MKLSMANFTPRARNLEIAANAAKILFLVIGIASTALLTAKFAFPYLLSILSFSLPKLWNYVISWLSPRYLFITVHFIIMVIWKLHKNQTPQDVIIDHNSSEIVDKEPTTEQLPWPPPEPEPELKEIHEVDTDSLDATWQAIISGKSTPVKNQLTKRDAWEKTKSVDTQEFNMSDAFRHHRDGDTAIEKITRTEGVVDIKKFNKSDTFVQKRDDHDTVVEKREMRKSKTFRESTGWRGRDALVVGRDELFGRVEAFIKMNYEQMRLQRQEIV